MATATLGDYPSKITDQQLAFRNLPEVSFVIRTEPGSTPSLVWPEVSEALTSDCVRFVLSTNLGGGDVRETSYYVGRRGVDYLRSIMERQFLRYAQPEPERGRGDSLGPPTPAKSFPMLTGFNDYEQSIWKMFALETLIEVTETFRTMDTGAVERVSGGVDDEDAILKTLRQGLSSLYRDLHQKVSLRSNGVDFVRTLLKSESNHRVWAGLYLTDFPIVGALQEDLLNLAKSVTRPEEIRRWAFVHLWPVKRREYLSRPLKAEGQTRGGQ